MAYSKSGAVHIETTRREGGPAVGHGTKISFSGFDDISACCRKTTVHIEAGKVITADLELFSTFSGEAESARLLMRHPVTGELVEVKRVEFADGTVLGGSE